MNYTREIDAIVWTATHCQDAAEQLAKWQDTLTTLQTRESELASSLYELVNKSTLCSKPTSTDRASIANTRQQLIQIRRHDLPVCRSVIARLS